MSNKTQACLAALATFWRCYPRPIQEEKLFPAIPTCEKTRVRWIREIQEVGRAHGFHLVFFADGSMNCVRIEWDARVPAMKACP